MKFDKEMVIAVILCGVLLFGWNPFCIYMGWVPDPNAAPAVAPAVAETEKPESPRPVTVPVAAPAAPVAPVAAVPLITVPLANDVLALTLDLGAGGISAIECKDYYRADKSQGRIVIDQIPSQKVGKALQTGALGVTIADPGWRGLLIAHKATGSSCRFTRRYTNAAGQAFDLTQNIALGDGYVITSDISFRNLTAVPLRFRMEVSGGELSPWETISDDVLRSDSLKLDYCTVGGSLTDVAADAKDSKFYRRAADLSWVSLSNKYFISMLQGAQPFDLMQRRVEIDDRYYVTAGAVQEVQLPAGGNPSYQFRLYAGPKIADQLEAFAPNATRTMHLAWGPFDYLARFLLWALVALKNICGSYGWSIVLLTVIVRLIFWPVTAKANASMKRMSDLQPKIKALREQYKDNPQMLNVKTMELYRQEKINPLGGCLPILLQIPVFFALYATLDGAIQLRQVSFLWAQDLAAPDTVCRLPGYLLGLPVNPLVLAMTLLMVLQQKLTPTTMDPMQQKMMMIMPVVMLFMLYNLPSGLTLYWTVSQVFSILQMILQHRTVFSKKKEQPAAAVGKQG